MLDTQGVHVLNQILSMLVALKKCNLIHTLKYFRSADVFVISYNQLTM